MPLYDFYHDYQINDDDIDCGRIIQVGCDGEHYYINPCDLLAECGYEPFIISDHRCEMVTDLGLNPGEILRVNATGDCIESVDINTLVNPAIFDYKVKVSAGDIPDYLNQQIIGISPILVDFPGGDVVRIRFDPTAIPTLPTPPTDCHAVLASQEGSSNYAWECTADNFWASRYVQNDFALTPVANTIEFEWVSSQVFEGNPDMDYTLSADKGIRIEETGMYLVWMNISSRVNRGVKNLRFFVFSVPNSKAILLNAKAWHEPISAIVPTGYTHTYVDMSRSAILKLEAGDVLVLAARTDNSAGTGVDPEVHIFSEALTWGSYWNGSFVWPHCGTGFGVSMISRNTFSAT